MALQASEFASQDFISNLPDSLVTEILERLPLQVAVRTSILSRSWRFKWTMLRQLLFHYNFFKYLIQTKAENKYGRIISMLLLHLQGPITKFDLLKFHIEDINHWISFLSRKGIKDLTLINWTRTEVKLSTHLFSCLKLKHLKLRYCYVNPPPPTFHGFPNLLTLELRDVRSGSANLEDIFSLSPLLEVLNLSSLYSMCPVNPVHIAKAKNLKILSWTLSYVDTSMVISSSSILELVGFLPKLQEIRLDFLDCKLIEDGAKRMLPPTFPSLKALKLSRVDLGNDIMLSFVLEMIERAPNLQILEITPVIQRDAKWMLPPTFPCLKALKLSRVDLGNDIMLSFVLEMIGRAPNLQILEITAIIQCDADPFPAVEYNTTRLQNVVLTSVKGLENEVCLIKYLLACSPFLKRIVIHPARGLGPSEQLVFTKKLLKLHRASSVAEIEF